MTETSSPVVDLTTLSLEQIQALQASLKEQAKEMVAEATSEFVESIGDSLTTVCEAVLLHFPGKSETGAWVGGAASGLPVTIEGRPHTVRVVVTDVIATKERELQIKATPKKRR